MALNGRRIIVTRAAEQAGEIVTQLQDRGAEVVLLPTIEIVPPPSWGRVDSAIDRLHEFDWILFTSANAVRAFFDRFALKRGIAPKQASLPPVCAIGDATRRTIEGFDIGVSLMPEESTSEGVLKAIVERVGGDAALRELSFLIPRARVSREVVEKALEGLGARVEAVEVYRTLAADVDPTPVVNELRNGLIDAVTFMSPSTVNNFVRMIGPDHANRLLAGCVIVCVGPVTARAARAVGLDPIVAQTQSTAAMVDTLEQSLGGAHDGRS